MHKHTFNLAEHEEEALYWLEKAYEERDPALFMIRDNSVWNSLRSDPRFQDLLRRMNFPQSEPSS